LTTVFSQLPDLVLIDLGLPDIDGQTVIALIRQQPSLQHVALIAFTAWPEDTAHNMAKAYGCDGVITKPIDTRAFVNQIQAYLDGVHTN
jgi:CheY-like chemotaxis protein